MSAAGHGGAFHVRRAGARFRSEAGGIASLDAFSRGDAFDPAWMGWGALRVLSRQAWAPGTARDESRVANMERLLLVREGALVADCGALGRHHVEAGNALRLHCGHGLQVHLANASGLAPMRLLECWWQPEWVNATPAAAVLGPDDALPCSRRMQVDFAGIDAGAALDLPPAPAGRRWLEVVDGELAVEGHGRIGPGDGLAWSAGATTAPQRLTATRSGSARVLLFSMPE